MEESQETKTASERILSHFASVYALTKTLGLANGTIRRRQRAGLPLVTAEEAIHLEKITSGQLPRWASRPDLWERDRDSPLDDETRQRERSETLPRPSPWSRLKGIFDQDVR